MSETAGTPLPGSTTPLFEHALRLHQQAPDEPLLRNGDPYPDESQHRRHRPKAPKLPSHSDPAKARELEAAAVVAVLDAHFGRPSSRPSELDGAFHGMHITIFYNEHVAAAAARPDRDRVRRTGRWLVRHGTDQCSVTVGLALLAAVATVDDIPLIQTIGLLSGQYGPLAACALERLPGGTGALLWLADRVKGWGRVYVVEALCRLDDPVARPWLRRKACEGDFLDGYFAAKVATTSRLHVAIDEFAGDSQIADHTGRLLRALDCSGRGATLAHYPHSAVVWAAHVEHAVALSPSVSRFFNIAVLAEFLSSASPENAGCTAVQQQTFLAAYVSLLERADWVRVAREGYEAGDERLRWYADYSRPGHLKLAAFTDRVPDTEK